MIIPSLTRAVKLCIGQLAFEILVESVMAFNTSEELLEETEIIIPQVFFAPD
jgi:hypothetical protein